MHVCLCVCVHCVAVQARILAADQSNVYILIFQPCFCFDGVGSRDNTSFNSPLFEDTPPLATVTTTEFPATHHCKVGPAQEFRFAYVPGRLGIKMDLSSLIYYYYNWLQCYVNTHIFFK